jgi:hypothetical protein
VTELYRGPHEAYAMMAVRGVASIIVACALLGGCQTRVDDQRLKDLEGRVSVLERRMMVARASALSSGTSSSPDSTDRHAAISPPAPISLPSGPPAQDPASAEPVLISHCNTQWPTNFEMQAYCQSQQREAVAKLNQSFPADLPPAVSALIRSQCAAKWPANYEMRTYCEGQQTDGYRTARH